MIDLALNLPYFRRNMFFKLMYDTILDDVLMYRGNSLKSFIVCKLKVSVQDLDIHG